MTVRTNPLHRLSPQHGYGPSRPADRHTHSDEVDYQYDPYREGDVSTPPACWDQHPERSETSRFYDPIVRWGDQVTLSMIHNGIAPGTVNTKAGQLVMYETKKPYGVRITMTAFDTGLAPANQGPNYFVTWTVLTGCGSAQRTYVFTQQVQLVPTPIGNDLILDVSAEVVRVSGIATFTNAFTPQKATPTLVAQCAPQVYLPDSEVGPRSNARNVIR